MTAATTAKAKGTEMTEAGTTTTAGTATEEETAATTAAATGGASTSETGEPDDNHKDGTTRAKRQRTKPGDREDIEQVHDADGDTRGNGSGADGTKAAQRSTGDGGTTSGSKKRRERGGRSERAYIAAQRKKNDKYGGEAT